jgi:SAM-dependent methyltransferase
MKTCRGCGNSNGNRDYSAKEMMLGRRTTFDYFECAECGSVQIVGIPPDLSDYYPPGYYSFQKPGKAKVFLKRKWANYSYTRNDLIGRILAKFMGENPAVVAVRKLNLSPGAAILDVGCGSGDLLQDLFSLGFINLRGTDPYNKEDIKFDGGILIWKKQLEQIHEHFDVVMLHHSLEHMFDPKSVFAETYRILATGGTLLIRVPLAGTYAWRKYKTNWVQLDAPRHLFIPSQLCIEKLATRFSFRLSSVFYDSTDFQFWGSEQYSRDIPLSDPRSHHRRPLNLIFPDTKIRQFKDKAKELNHAKDGDSGCFYLTKL